MKMKVLLIVSLMIILALALSAFVTPEYDEQKFPKLKNVRFQVINKSNKTIWIEIGPGQNIGQHYYLTVQKGTPDFPFIIDYVVPSDKHELVNVFYGDIIEVVQEDGSVIPSENPQAEGRCISGLQDELGRNYNVREFLDLTKNRRFVVRCWPRAPFGVTYFEPDYSFSPEVVNYTYPKNVTKYVY